MFKKSGLSIFSQSYLLIEYLTGIRIFCQNKAWLHTKKSTDDHKDLCMVQGAYSRKAVGVLYAYRIEEVWARCPKVSGDGAFIIPPHNAMKGDALGELGEMVETGEKWGKKLGESKNPGVKKWEKLGKVYYSQRLIEFGK